MTAYDVLMVILAGAIFLTFSTAMLAAINHLIDTDTTPRIKRSR